MPTVLRVDGFQVRIFPNDHPPAHVHVFKTGAAIVIELGTASRPPRIREISGMARPDAVKAVTLVEEQQIITTEVGGAPWLGLG